MVAWAIRQVMIWGTLGLVVFIAVEYRSSLSGSATGSGGAASEAKVAARSADSAGRVLTFRANGNGHFIVNAVIKGHEVVFMVDTGATLTTLSRTDAKRIGLHPKRLDYNLTVHTANGVVRAAPVTLREVRIGRMRVRNVRAAVNEAPMAISLLGNSFLSRLPSYQVRDGKLVMRW